MTRFQQKSSIKLKDYKHFKYVILWHFPELEYKIFKQSYVSIGDVNTLIKMCGYKKMPLMGNWNNVTNLEPLVNYMIDNKHMYEWWCL